MHVHVRVFAPMHTHMNAGRWHLVSCHIPLRLDLLLNVDFFFFYGYRKARLPSQHAPRIYLSAPLSAGVTSSQITLEFT